MKLAPVLFAFALALAPGEGLEAQPKPQGSFKSIYTSVFGSSKCPYEDAQKEHGGAKDSW